MYTFVKNWHGEKIGGTAFRETTICKIFRKCIQNNNVQKMIHCTNLQKKFKKNNLQNKEKYQERQWQIYRLKKNQGKVDLKGWLAIAKLKPLSLFISLLSMPKKAFDNVKIEK